MLIKFGHIRCRNHKTRKHQHPCHVCIALNECQRLGQLMVVTATQFHRQGFLFWFKFHWNLFPSSKSQWVSNRLGNDLVPNRRQAITWNNADPVHWHIYASLGDNGVQRCEVSWVKCGKPLTRFCVLYDRHDQGTTLESGVFDKMGDCGCVWTG